jgi:hypothetical protein
MFSFNTHVSQESVHLVGFIIGIYHVARPHERKVYVHFLFPPSSHYSDDGPNSLAKLPAAMLLLLVATAQTALLPTQLFKLPVRLTVRNVRKGKREEVSSAVDFVSGSALLDFGKGTLNVLSTFMVVLPSPFRTNGGISILATIFSFHFPISSLFSSCTGRFIMFSLIINTYYKKTKGPN